MHYTSLLGDHVQLDLLSEETIPQVETDAPHAAKRGGTGFAGDPRRSGTLRGGSS